MKFGARSLVCATVAALLSTQAVATVLTFDDFSHGTVVTDQYAGYGVYVSADNNRFNNSNKDRAVVYDSMTRPGNNTSNRDTDLNGPNWGNSNLGNKNSVNKGGVLILQENTRGCGDGVCNRPDDEAGFRNNKPRLTPVGNLTFSFDFEIGTFGFDILDVELSEADDYKLEFYSDFSKAANGSVTLDAADLLDSISFLSFINSDGAVFGDNSLNRISPISLDYAEAVRVANIVMGGSGAIDDITYTAVSEPATIAFGTLGLAAIFALRRRKAVR